MSCDNPIKNLLSKWPTRAVLAGEINVKVDRVHKWAQSGSIPNDFLAGILKSAKSHNIELTADELVEFLSKNKTEALK